MVKMLKPAARQLGSGSRYLQRSPSQEERERGARRPDRARYKTAEWQRLRWKVLVRDDFTCAICGYQAALAPSCRDLKAIGRPDLIKGRAPELVADHIDPHRGDEAKFWNLANLQCLCSACHNSEKQRQERRGP